MAEAAMAAGAAGGAVSVTVRDLGPQGMVTLRGDLADAALAAVVTEITGAPMPGPRGITRGSGGAAAWMSPDELMLFLPAGTAGAAVARIGAALEGRHHLALDVSDARAVLAVEGAWARELLAKCSPADLHPDSLPEGEIRRTRLGQIAAAFWCEGGGIWRVIVFRSVAGYAQALLERSAGDGPVGVFGTAG